MTGARTQGIVASDLRFSYSGGAERQAAVQGVSLSVPHGSVAAVVGPNGSGKSTLLKMISAYLKPSSGSVLLDGRDPFALSHAGRSRLVTYCGDEPDPAFDFTVEETVEMGRQVGGNLASRQYSNLGTHLAAANALAARVIVEEAMRQVGVFGLRSRTITSLSSGERQRVYIARAICQDPEVFLLDEPTAHLDMAYELQVMDLVVGLARDRAKTVLVVVHDLNLALRYASKVFFMKNGLMLHEMEPAAVTPDIVREVYGVDVQMTVNPAAGCPVVMPVRPE